jgi:secondary thiamine-phosphate synthase enzyme
MDSEVISLETGHERRAIDITAEVARFASGRGDGLVQVFCPHATAGIAVMETGAGSDDDLLDLIDEMLPPDFAYRHRHGSPGHGADHVLPAIISPSVTLPVLGGELQLGTWQSVVLVDPNRDNSRRQVRFSFLS